MRCFVSFGLTRSPQGTWSPPGEDLIKSTGVWCHLVLSAGKFLLFPFSATCPGLPGRRKESSDKFPSMGTHLQTSPGSAPNISTAISGFRISWPLSFLVFRLQQVVGASRCHAASLPAGPGSPPLPSVVFPLLPFPTSGSALGLVPVCPISSLSLGRLSSRRCSSGPCS